MRIRFLIAQFHPRVGGAERQALLQARTLTAKGHQVVVHTLRYRPDWPSRETMSGIEVRRHGATILGGRLRLGHGLHWLTVALIFVALLRERRQFDVLHIHQLSWLALVGVAVRALLRKPVVVKLGSASAGPLAMAATADVPPNSFTQSDTVGLAKRRGIGSWLLTQSGICLVATSGRMATELRRLGWPAERLRINPNGVALTVPNVSARSTRLPGATLEVVCVARLSYEKGIDTLLDAWACVWHCHPAAHLTVVGSGPLEHRLRAHAARLGLAESVRFTGHVDDPNGLLDVADVFVLPSRYEGMPNALLEALARGLPAVATRVSGSEDVIEDKVSGLLVEPDNADEMATAICRLLEDSALRDQFAFAGLARIQAEYDIERIVTRYVDIYAAEREDSRRRPSYGTKQQLLTAAMLLMTGTVLTKAVGLLNQVFASSHFGAGAEMDAYFAVLAVPVFVTGVVTATLTSAVTPEYMRVRAHAGLPAAISLFQAFLWSTTGLSVVASGLLVMLGPWVVRATAPGLNPEQLSAAEVLVPFIFPLLAVNTATGVVTGIVNAEGRFGLPAYAGILVPGAMIAATLAIGSGWGVSALAVGMLVGSVLQLVVTLAVASSVGLEWLPRHPFAVQGLGNVARSAAPLGLGVLIVQMSPVIDQIVASWLPVGSLSAINYSLKLIDIPVVGLFMTASRVLLPRFSSQASVSNFVGLAHTMRSSIWFMSAAVLPITLVCIFFSTDIVRAFYQRGAFSDEAVEMTAGCLVGFAVGLLPMGVGFILPKVFNAIGRNSTLAWFSVLTLISNAGLDVILAHFWQHVGIAVSTSITYAIVSVGMLVLVRRYLRRLSKADSEVSANRAYQYGAS